MKQSSIFFDGSKDSIKEFETAINSARDSILNYFKTDRAYSGKTPEELKEIIENDVFFPEDGVSAKELFSQLNSNIVSNLVNTVSTDYMAHLHCPPMISSIASEVIIGATNQSMDSWDQAPMSTEIEVYVVNELIKLYNLGEKADGVFTSGGSQSNLTGLFAARDWYCKTNLNHDVKYLGLPPSYNKFRIYTSSIAHFSTEKSAHLMGLGYNAVRKVPVDDRQKMNISSLKEMINQDIKNGLIPIAVVATIGTTDFGSIDPIKDIRIICDNNKMWLHADAAFGSGLILSHKYRDRLDGLNLADSITVDFHKMFMQSISCGVFLLKDQANFETTSLYADYLNREEDEEEGYTNLVGKSLQTTRRFDALKIWMSFKLIGKEGFDELITKTVDLALETYNLLSNNRDFEVVTKPEISSIVFRLLDKNKSDIEVDNLNAKIRKTLLLKKGVVIGQTKANGRVFLKLTMLNPLLNIERINRLLREIKALA